MTALAKEYDTPLYIYDAATIKEQVSILKQLLEKQYGMNASIAYATKAYFSLSFARKLRELGIGADLITIGDIRTAQKAALDPGLLHLHGNNKSEEEIRAALEWGIGAIVIDSLDELSFVEAIAKDMQKKARIWLRITPDITVDTHRHIQTSHAASKFGLHISDGQAAQAVRRHQEVNGSILLVCIHILGRSYGIQKYMKKPSGRCMPWQLKMVLSPRNSPREAAGEYATQKKTSQMNLDCGLKRFHAASNRNARAGVGHCHISDRTGAFYGCQRQGWHSIQSDRKSKLLTGSILWRLMAASRIILAWHCMVRAIQPWSLTGLTLPMRSSHEL